ncbi:protein-tyrosine-phosphatase [Devosia yakushimensis]|uniref:Protein-tyrosine-phosphatase n=1 Tax=Devosia yakushimensis TaxID=470028 RepID=A0ABQ5UEC3_9HYPH|nr:tyrosine-protein phosphatase [Devosia yakushimensis]GLQ09717.1 protein-tyrosine-phosphatase [Devosia yakushimensis]
MSIAFDRHMPLADTHNIRDLGGYARADGGSTQWRRILRGDSLSHLREAGRAHLLAQGLSTVIDLRGPHETAGEPNPFQGHASVDYRNIALFDALAPIAAGDAGFDMGARYREALDRCGDRLAEVLRAIAAAPQGIVLFHCTAGKDRTGIVSAMLLLLSGVSEADVAKDYTLTATLADPLIARLRLVAQARGLDDAHIDRVLSSDAATMMDMLQYLRLQHGGIAAYGTAIGLARTDIDTLVSRLCD